MRPADAAAGLDALGRASMDGAEPPFSFLEIDQSLDEVQAPEIRPENRSDPDLGIGDLPEQEIGNPKLTARPDKEVGIGDSGRIQTPGEGLFV